MSVYALLHERFASPYVYVANGGGRVTRTAVALPPEPVDIFDLLTSWANWLTEQEGVVALPYAPTGDRMAFVDGMRARGWRTSDAAVVHGSGWFRFARTDHRTEGLNVLHVLVTTWSRDEDEFLPLATLDAVQVAERLGWWHETMGHPYRVSPAVATTAVIAGMLRVPGKGSPMMRQPTSQATWDLEALQGCGDIKETTDDPRQRWKFDMRSAYLAAASMAELGWGPLRHTGADPQHGAPGYYRVTVPKRLLWIVNRNRPATSGTFWVTAPIMDYAYTMYGQALQVHDSWTAQTGGRLLRPWSERWRDLIALHPRWTDVLKAGYTRAFGLMAAPGGQIYRRDWLHTIEDTVRVSMLRRIRRVEKATGLLPVRINVDELQYAVVDSPETFGHILAAVGLGDKIGNMRYEGVVPAPTIEEKGRKRGSRRRAR